MQKQEEEQTFYLCPVWFGFSYVDIFITFNRGARLWAIVFGFIFAFLF